MGHLTSKESIDSQKGKVQFPLTRLSVSLMQTAGRDAYPIPFSFSFPCQK